MLILRSGLRPSLRLSKQLHHPRFSHNNWTKEPEGVTSRPQMQAAFQQRRLGVAQDCHRLKQDVDSYNENWNKSIEIQMEFDFRDDMRDMEHDSGLDDE